MSEDHQVQQAVLTELDREPGVTAAHIGVTADGGVVTLTGHVKGFMEKHRAAEAAARVKDVKAVANELEVRLSADDKRTDEDIARAAIGRLAWNASVPWDSIKVTVEDGWLTLTGQVEWYYQMDAAEQDLRHLLGVVGISNEITIKPKVDAANISDDIMHALHRSWFFDPNTIKVTAQGGKVRLTGTARSQHERGVAAATAWAEPGVVDVANDIVVA
jgi:osmotically-inducible protein OsmY